MEDHYEPLIYTMNAADVPPEPPSAKDNHRRLPGTLVAVSVVKDKEALNLIIL
jgi:hypothetical protein